MKGKDSKEDVKPDDSKPSEDVQEKEIEHRNRDKWVEIASAVLLSLAMIASAWCAYQAARWSGVQTTRYNEASAARADATENHVWSAWSSQSDIIAFNDYQIERLAGNQEAMEYFKENVFSDQLYDIFDEWLATDPYNDPNAPYTPFDMDDYQYPWYDQAVADEAEAQEKVNKAKAANQQSDNYVLLTVLFATVLFFAGISTKFESIYVKIVILSGGAVVFVVALSVLAFQPIY